MRLLQFLLLLQIYVYNNAQYSKSRAVNLAIETIFEFDNNDNSADVRIIDKIKSFLDRIKSVIDKNRSARRNLSLKDLKFTDFIRNVLIILNSYDDNDLEDILSIVDEEMRKYHYKGCKFYELVDDYNLRRYMAGKLDKFKRSPATKIRSLLDSLLTEMEEGKFDGNLQDLCDYIDSLYEGKSAEKLSAFLENLALYHQKSKRANMNIVKIVRQGIRSVIFDHYTSLDYETRRDLKIKLETFWRDLNNPGTGHHQVWEYEPKKVINNNFKIDDIDINIDTSKIAKLKDKDKSKRKHHGKKSKHGGKNKTTSLRHKSSEKVQMENRFLHDSKIAIDVSKLESSDTDADVTTKKDKLSINTLYPEPFTYIDATKHSKKHRKDSVTTKKPKSHKKKSHKIHNKKKPAEKTEKENETDEKNEVKSPKKHEDLKKLVHKQESEIAAKKAEMEKLLAEHEKIKKVVEAQQDSSDDSSEGELKRDFQAIEKEKNLKDKAKFSNNKKSKKIKNKIKKKPKTSSELSGSEEVHRAKINVNEARKYYKKKDSSEGIPIESDEFERLDLRKHYTNTNISTTTLPDYDTRGFPTIDPDYPKRFSTKPTQVQYKSGISTMPIPIQLKNKTHVERKIKVLETELQKVKEQIKVEPKPDYIDIPTYDILDFWEGTTKKSNGTNTHPTTTTTTEALGTTETETRSTTRSESTTTKTNYHTMPLATYGETSIGVPNFRIRINATKTSVPYFRVEYTKIPVKVPEKRIQKKSFDSKSVNSSAQEHILDINNEINNYSRTFDDNYELGFDNLDHDTNITAHLAKLENYVNTTRDNGNDKEVIVRKKMLADLKDILDDHEPAGNLSVAQLLPTDIDSVREGNKNLFDLMDGNDPL